MSKFHVIFDKVGTGITASCLNATESFLGKYLTEPAKQALALRDQLLAKVPHAAIMTAVLAGGMGAAGNAAADGYFNNQGAAMGVLTLIEGINGAVNGERPDPNRIIMSQAAGNVVGAAVSNDKRGVGEAAGYLATTAIIKNFGRGQQNQQQQAGGYNQQVYTTAPQMQQSPQNQYMGQSQAAQNFRYQSEGLISNIIGNQQRGQFEARDRSCVEAVNYAINNAALGIRSQEYENTLRQICPQHIWNQMYAQSNTQMSPAAYRR